MLSKTGLYGGLLQCLFISVLFAFDGSAQGRTSVRDFKMDLAVSERPLNEVFSVIESKSGFSFFYDEKVVNHRQKVSISAEGSSLADILVEISKQTNLKFRQINNSINVNNLPRKKTEELERIEISEQSITITGRVTDRDNNDALPGASVMVKGTATGTVTDIDGRYSINVSSPESILVFSSVGYQSQEITVGNNSQINITLRVDVTALDEIVVVGYGTQRKSDVTGSVGVVTAEDLLRAPVNNALQGLEGRVAGVNVFLNSGSPTSSPRRLIRGLGTINANSSPLFVVDGVVMEDIQFLNPNDIERMEVLKDASSTAIYGARGANGVILITTRRGAKTEGMVVSYEGFLSFGELRRKMDLLNAEEWLEVVERGMANTPKYRPGVNPVFTTNDPRLFDANGRPLYDTDWQEEATRTAVSHNHQFAIQQRAEKSNYGVFLNYSRMEGIMLENWMDRLNAKVAYEGTPKKWLTVGFNMLANYTKENEFEEGGGHQMPRRTMIEMPPIFPVRFPDGTWANSSMITDAYNVEPMANPVHVLRTQDRLRTRTQLFGNAYLVFHLAEGLDFRTQFGFDKHDRLFQTYSPTDLLNISDPLGSANLSSNNVLFWQQENFLSYNKEKGDHRFNGVLGLSWQARTFENFGITTRGFADDFFRFHSVQVASLPDAPTSTFDHWSLSSYFLRGGYTYKDKYMVTVTSRLDGSSRFGSDNKFGFFPSAGVGWMLSNESFMENLTSVNQLKLRSSYGVTGNTEIPTYQSLATVSSGTVLLNGRRATHSWVNRLANPGLSWERTQQFDVGMDLSLFNYKLNIELDYYYRLTTDLLLGRPVPQTTGFGSVVDNIGSVSNQGIEMMISSTLFQNNKFSWESTLNFNYNINRVEKLGENDEDIFPGPWWVSGSQTILRVGEPLSSFWGFERLGIWGTDEAAQAAEVGRVPGEAKRSAQPTIIGNGLPKLTGSFINTVRYKNFDFTVDLQFVGGVDILQQFYHSTEDRSGIANGLRTILTQGWTPQNQNTMVQEIRNQAYAGQNSEIDTRWVVDGSYIRGNLLQLGYTFDKDFLSRLNIKGLRAYANVMNAFVIHDREFQGLDPEATSWGGNQWGQNIFFFQYPRPRTYTLGVSVQF